MEPEAQEHADRVLEKNAKKVCRDAFSNARLQVVNACMKRRGHSINNFRQYSDVYLTVDQYMEVTLPWMEHRPQAYKALCEIWASPEWIEKSNRNRHRQRHQQDEDDDEVVVNHTYGADGHIRLAKRMEAQTGVVPSPIDVYRRGHRAKTVKSPMSCVVKRPLSVWRHTGRRWLRSMEKTTIGEERLPSTLRLCIHFEARRMDDILCLPVLSIRRSCVLVAALRRRRAVVVAAVVAALYLALRKL